MKLVYSGERDGFNLKAFHYKCDGHENTITVIRSGRRIFGGFIGAAWKSSDKPITSVDFISCSRAWVFSLSSFSSTPSSSPSSPSQSSTPLMKAICVRPDAAVATCAVNFGWMANGLIIDNDMRSKTNFTRTSGEEIVYKLADGYMGPYTNESLAGTLKFSVEEMEVFQCLFDKKGTATNH